MLSVVSAIAVCWQSTCIPPTFAREVKKIHKSTRALIRFLKNELFLRWLTWPSVSSLKSLYQSSSSQFSDCSSFIKLLTFPAELYVANTHTHTVQYCKVQHAQHIHTQCCGSRLHIISGLHHVHAGVCTDGHGRMNTHWEVGQLDECLLDVLVMDPRPANKPESTKSSALAALSRSRRNSDKGSIREGVWSALSCATLWAC